MNNKRKIGREVKKRRKIREDYKAFIRIHLSKSGVWKIEEFFFYIVIAPRL